MSENNGMMMGLSPFQKLKMSVQGPPMFFFYTFSVFHKHALIVIKGNVLLNIFSRISLTA